MMKISAFLLVFTPACASLPTTEPPVATFSIVAFDPATKELGIAVQSKFLGVGAVVPWAKAGVGAIATQSFANTAYGPDGLTLLAKGMPADQVLEKLTSADRGKPRRQVGIVDAKGKAATITSDRCMNWAGGIAKPNYCVQGNILADEEVVKAMAKGFENAEDDLGDRLIAALQAGQEAGGDKRGRQSAALLIVKERGGYGGLNDRYRDVRVDDHKTPIKELKRIYQLHKRVFGWRSRRRGDAQRRRLNRQAAMLTRIKADLSAIIGGVARYCLRERKLPKDLSALVRLDADGSRYLREIPNDP